MGFKFEDLRVWQKAVELTDDVYTLTEKFPREEMFGLSSQIRRAANSIVLNIAEGASGNTNAEFKRFLVMAARSCAEVISCLHLAKRRKYINDDEFSTVYMKTEEVYKMINKLKATLK